MISVDNIHRFEFESVPIDEFWNTGAERELLMHQIHSYPAKFPSFITTKALEYAALHGYRPQILADIFCGCGTTAIEARRNCIGFWGCDINPVATLIARVKSRKYQSSRLLDYFENIISNCKTTEDIFDYSKADERLKYWYPKNKYNDLFKLKSSILAVTPGKSDYRLFFLCAFSSILKSTSRWLTKSIKPQIDPAKRPAIVLEAFDLQFRKMLAANREIEFNGRSSLKIVTGNFLSNTRALPKVDMIVTSPPYVTSYEYADLHQLSTLWLDFAHDYRDLRKGSIGSRHHDYNFNRELKRLNETGHKIVTQLLNYQKSKARNVAKYFLDMQEVAKRSFGMLAENGFALFVIGNTEYKGIRIDNAKHLAEALIESGFVEIRVTKRKISNKILTPYRDKLGKFSSNGNGRKVYSEEFIIIGRKRS